MRQSTPFDRTGFLYQLQGELSAVRTAEVGAWLRKLVLGYYRY